MILAIMALAAWGLPSAPAHANGYLVTKTADTGFICNADCSLREAIYERTIQARDAISGGGREQLTIPGGEDAGLTGDRHLE
jgi:CSLREA domain-containing protein